MTAGRRPTRLPLLVVLAFLVLLAATTLPARADIVGATSAADLCPPTADPCVVTQTVTVVSGSLLDFGSRGLTIGTGGSLVVGSGTVTVRCGAFRTIAATGTLINVRAPSPLGGFDGGDFRLQADDVVLAGNVRAQADEPGTVSITARGNVALQALIDVHATDPDADGGEVSIESTAGDVVLTGTIDATSGRFSEGGLVELTAARDVDVAGLVDADGGEFDGGTIFISAGRDVRVRADLRASAVNLDGSGGTIDVEAGRDLSFEDPAFIGGNGSRSADNFAGDGGIHTFTAGRNLTVASGVLVQLNGARPDGGGGEISFVANGALTIAGRVQASTSGADGVGGDLALEGCDVRLVAGGTLDASGDDGAVRIAARESATIASGSSIAAGSAVGSVRIAYRRPEAPPVVQGQVTPPALVAVDTTLPACTVCGDRRVDQGETCDDGNTTPGDGCNAECQDEGCIADTPGYPDVTLCDDERACTTDACAGGACTHLVACDDAVACTVDACGPSGACTHSPDDRVCDDGNPCTTNSCDALFGCIDLANSAPCDDGLACTVGDRCSNRICVGVPDCPEGSTCSLLSGRCVVDGSTTTMPTSTTTTTTDGLRMCGNLTLEGAEQCDDGDVLWERGQACRADCSLVACGDPDDSGRLTASDALFILRAAVGVEVCDRCVCDVDSTSGPPRASDALRVLWVAVGLDIELRCPICA